ncbi:hypothetical protein Tco_0481535 [Tanacetum coccineum]
MSEKSFKRELALVGTFKHLYESEFFSTSNSVAIMTGNLLSPSKKAYSMMGGSFLEFKTRRFFNENWLLLVSQTLSSVRFSGEIMFLDLEGGTVVFAISKWLLDYRCYPLRNNIEWIIMLAQSGSSALDHGKESASFEKQGATMGSKTGSLIGSDLYRRLAGVQTVLVRMGTIASNTTIAQTDFDREGAGAEAWFLLVLRAMDREISLCSSTSD